MRHLYFIILTVFISVAALSQVPQNLESELVLLNIKTGKETVILREKRHFEAPNWSRDGKYLIINANGKLERISLKGKKLGIIDTRFADQCNNDHGLTLDGRWLIISYNDPQVTSPGGNSRIFMLPSVGGVPRLITGSYPSYWHGVSPDNRWVTYCAMRKGEWDVYKTDVFTDEEIRLTDAAGLDDGPEYSYDGQWTISTAIVRGGCMFIACVRMGANKRNSPSTITTIGFPILRPTTKASLISHIWRTSKVDIRSGKM